MFKIKLTICWFLIFVNIIVIIVSISAYWLVETKSEDDNCMLSYEAREIIFPIMRFFRVIAWAVCIKLLVYQYRKGLSEHWYSHQMFWILSFIVQVASVIWGIVEKVNNKDERHFHKVIGSPEVFLRID